MKKILCIFIFGFFINSIFSYSISEKKISFTDLANRNIEIEQPIDRIFLGFYQESYLAVAENFDKVVSMSEAEWKDFLNDQYAAYKEKLPEINKITDTGSIYKGAFSMETLLNSKPQVAIMAPFQYETLGENIQKLEKSGVKVVVIDYNSQTLDKHIKSTEILGKIIGKQERANRLIENYKTSIKTIADRVDQVTKKKKVYIELGNLGANQIGNTYGNYLWGNLVKIAGGRNIAENKVESYGPLSPEYILISNPEAIFFAGANWTNDSGDRVLMGFNVKTQQVHERISQYLKRDGWGKISAVKNNEVYAVNHGGLRSIYDYVYVQYIAKSLYPDLFKDINPEENLKKFYKEYLPIIPEGTFMIKYDENI